jgi:ParB family chromosome partitioning protein
MTGALESAPAPTALGDREATLLPVERIQANPNQPRKSIDEEALRELSASIRTHGVIQPILVRRIGGGYELIAGERRLRATRMAGLNEIPALICSVEEAESLKLALLENIQREDLNPIEEAEAYRAIMDRYGATHQEVADMLGKNRSTVTNIVRLLGLEASIRELVRGGNISMGHAGCLLGVDDPAIRLRLARRVARDELSVRALEAKVQLLSGERKPRKATATARDPDAAALREFEQRLQHHLGSPARIVRKGQRGRIEVLFYSDEELERVLEQMGISSQL